MSNQRDPFCPIASSLGTNLTLTNALANVLELRRGSNRLFKIPADSLLPMRMGRLTMLARVMRPNVSLRSFPVIKPLLATALGILLIPLLTGCTVGQRQDLVTSVSVYGPLRGYVEDESGNRWGYELHDPPRRVSQRLVNVASASHLPPHYSIRLSEPSDFEGIFRVVEPGPMFVELRTERLAEGLFMTDSDLIAKALFFISAKQGATVSLEFRTGQDPGDLRLRIDHDGDGSIDDEIEPSGWWGGDKEVTPVPDLGSQARVEELPDGRARVTLQASPSDRADAHEVTLYYFRYPQDTVAQVYREPFIVDQRMYLQYGVFESQGVLGVVHELHLLGGLGLDSTVDLPTDGTPVNVEFQAPGRHVTLRYHATVGEHLEFVLEDLHIGVLAEPEEVGVSGRERVRYQDVRETRIYEVRLNPAWGYTGEVAVRLTNLNEHATYLEVDGPPVQELFEIPGQKGVDNFDGVSNTQVELSVVELEGENLFAGGLQRLTVIAPNGDVLIDETVADEPGETLELLLPEDGRYRIEVDPVGNATGTAVLELRSTTTVTPSPTP